MLAVLVSGCDSQRGDFVVSNTSPGPFEVRRLDGSQNNLFNPQLGTAGSRLLREVPIAYDDMMASPSGVNRPAPRNISNTCVSQAADMPDPTGHSAYVWAWGQFIDHDLDLTGTGSEAFDIPIPAGDPFFDPFNLGNLVMPFARSVFDPDTGTDPSNPRQQINQITAFLDGSGIYGSDVDRAAALRTFEGGMLKTSAGDLLPFNLDGLPNDDPTGQPPTSLFLAGDRRANEQIALTSLHTLFVREHNRQARLLGQALVGLSDEQIYQLARKRVGALVQVVTYQEFLPAILGPGALPPYTGYNPNIDPGIDILFSTAAFRFGHSLVGPTLLRLDASGQPIAAGNLAIRDAFFQPTRLVTEGGIDPVLRGLAATPMQQLDPNIIDDLRSFLFGPPGSGGLDLACLNIQRGRDHGLPDFNTVRVACGLAPLASFAQLTGDQARAQGLATLYGSPDNLDPWVGFLAEDPAPGGLVGPTLRVVLIKQFTRLRDGDRFFYANDPSLAAFRGELEATTLADIIARNTEATIQGDAFKTP